MRTLLSAFLMFCIASTAYAMVVGPYPVDPNTLHLYSFDYDGRDSAGTFDLAVYQGATISDGYLSTYDNGASTTGPLASDATGMENQSALSNFIGADGSFTFEAVVRPDIAAGSLVNHMEIICGENDGGPTDRGFQFRIESTGTTLRFQTLSGSTESYDEPISYTVGQWYHAAVTYNAATDELKTYWTALSTGATAATEVGSWTGVAALEGADMTRFCVGNELRSTGGYGNENWEGLIDEVRISGVARSADDMLFRSSTPWARNPNPAYKQTNVDPSTTTQLAWDTAEAANVTKHYLYLVADEPNFPSVSPIVVTDTTDPIEYPVTLSTDKIYFWRVDESINNSGPSDADTITGPIWYFKTIVAVPGAIINPEDTAVFPTESASFEAGFNSISTPTASWYKEGDPNPLASQAGVGATTSGDITVTVTDLGNESYSTELQIANVENADQGYYYCSIANSSSGTVESELAGLTVKRLLAHYPFDGNPNDAAGSIDGTLKNIDPNASLPGFITGVPHLGQAIVLDGTQYVELSTAAYPHEGLGNGLEMGTVSYWVRIDAFTATAMVMGVHNDGTGPACQTWFDNDGTRINFRLRQNTGDTEMPYMLGTTETSLVGDGQWHLIAATFAKGDIGQLYLDGLPFGATDSYTAVPEFNPWDYPMLIGANNNRGAVVDLLTGAIDDVRIYNYRLSNLEVADLYLAGYPDAKFCILDYASKFDFTGPDGAPDCVVNLLDFAQFAAAWLDSGIYP